MTRQMTGHVTRQVTRQRVYTISVQGVVDQDWATWFGGVAISAGNDSLAGDGDGNDITGITVLTCHVNDQAALHAILNKIRDLNLTLLSLARVSPTQNVSADP